MNEWKAEYDALMLNTQQVIAERDALRQQLAALTAECGKLREALEQVRHIAVQRDVVASWGLLRDTVEDIEQIARAALADAPDAE